MGGLPWSMVGGERDTPYPAPLTHMLYTYIPPAMNLFRQPAFSQVLSLHRNDIGDDGAVAIADALVHNKSLQKLFLNYNCIGERGMNAIARALCQNESLSMVCLTHNDAFSDDLKVAFDQASRMKDDRFKVFL